jgi:hypothetical protein
MARTDESPRPYWLDDDKSPAALPKPKRPRSVWLFVGAITVVVIIVASLLLTAITKVRYAADCAQSHNNLKQMGIGIHNIASVYNGLEPPVVGDFPIGTRAPRLSFFFHIIPHIESDNIYSRFSRNPAALTPEEATVKIYSAPGDPSNPGTNTLLLSYCVNGAVFDGRHGGSTHIPAIMNDKGTANTVFLFERFAVCAGRQREWHDMKPYGVWLYSPYDGGDGFDDFPYDRRPADASIETGFLDRYGNDGEVDFGKRPATVSHADKPHAFNLTEINVLLGDGSARAVSTKANATFDVDGRPVRIWAWACSVQGSLGKRDVPNGW